VISEVKPTYSLLFYVQLTSIRSSCQFPIRTPGLYIVVTLSNAILEGILVDLSLSHSHRMALQQFGQRALFTLSWKQA